MGMFRNRRRASDFSAEVEAHIELEIERLQESGLSAEEARAVARRTFGNVTRAQERFYRARRWFWWDSLWQDLRFGLRMLAKRPGFLAVALLTLALGIGATTVIFSAVYAVLLKPLPFRQPARLVFVEKRNPPRGWVRNPISPAEALAWRDHSGAFEDLAAFTGTSCVLNGAGEAEEDPCEIAGSNLFPLLGATPLMGRTFSPAEDNEGATRVAILSYRLWQRRFGADASAIGRAIEVNHASYTIVGVMPASFSHLYATPYGPVPAMWISGIALSATDTDNNYFAIGRLKPGTGMEQAQAQMDQVSLRIDQAHPDLKGWRAQLMSLRTLVSGDTRSALVVLMGAVIFVLLIACANMANLLLARGASRASEFAVRSVLGAGEARMVRQLLTESLLIALAGGSVGVLLAFWGCRGLAAVAPQYLLHAAPDLARGAADARVLAFTLLTTVATTIFFGLAPALQSARPHLTDTLKEAGRGTGQSRRNRRFRSVLVVSEIALTMVLMAGAGLMVRTLAQLGRVSLGFNAANVLTLRVPLSGDRYEQPKAQAEFWEHLMGAVKMLPGVEATSVSRGLPTGDWWAGQFFTTYDRPSPAAGEVPDANYIVAGPDYFRALKIPLRKGRSFNERDTEAAGKVAIVNEELTRLYWPGQDPLGKQLRPGSPQSTAPWLTVVGVAGNVRSQRPDIPFHAEIYVPYQQFPWVQSPDHLLVRTSGAVKPETLVHAVVREVHRIDEGMPAVDVMTMEQAVREPMVQQRMVMALMVAFAGLALVLSAMGTYSVLSYSIAQRTREIGMRMALGAQRGEVLRLVIGDGLRLAIIGIVVGIAAGLALTELMTELLFGVRATDPVTFASVTAVLVLSSLFASYIPARRAISVDPMVALRHE